MSDRGARTEGVWVIVAAGGRGVRFGRPKQFSPMGGRRVLDWTVEGAAEVAEGVVVVVPADRELMDGWNPAAGDGVTVVEGGVLRSDSVRCGLEAVPASAEVVLVHDGARPLADAGVYGRVIAAVRDGADGAVPVMDVSDTLRRREGGAADRSQFVAVQTPQAFRAEALRAAHVGEPDASDDATLVEAAGGKVVTVPGDSRNIKITNPHDIAVAETLLGESSLPKSDGQIRVGQGFDVHRYSDDAGRTLVLGGVRFEDERGLHGHSDADVVAHACIEALLAAASLGDIGQFFPDNDPAWADADSIELLRLAAHAVRDAGWAPVNVSCTVVLDSPRIAPHRAEMQDRLSDAAGAPVTVTGRSSEGVGALGRGEGVAALAVASVSAVRP